ncbi:MAG: ABC transporter ATP-binding protein [Planctomycetes bacterium]|nr:ABC transporter ATP-binding protein [Planctomycetota bacterium]
MVAPTTAAGIVARGVTRRFGSKLALEPVDLDARPGEITGLLGPNGSGKSTLMRCLVGITRADGGEVSVAGVTLAGDGLAVRKVCAYAPGELSLFGELRADEHLAWLVRGRPRDTLERARSIARELELPLAARVRTFSHGMKRQLLFAATMAPRVPVRILDEASEGLDPHKRGALVAVLERDARAGTTILLSSHHLGEVDRACKELVFLHRGKVIYRGSSVDVRARASHRVRVLFQDDAERARFEARAQSLPASRRHALGSALIFEYEGDDPRPFLAALATLPDAPAPRALDYGELSLEELYRDLYGVEAC